MSSSRRDFLKNLGFSAAFGISGGIKTMASPDIFDAKNKVKLRFLVASDFHFGQAKTDFMGMTSVFLKQANAIHKIQKFDYCVLNGDLIHDAPEFMPQVKSQFDSLEMPYFVTKGNHDMIDDQTWENIWKMPSNHSFATKKYAIILANTSNEKGEYLSPNIEWVSKKLEEFKNIENVFVFAHIPQSKKTKNGIDTPEFYDIINQYSNVRAVFHGHEHDQDGVHFDKKVPVIFDAHVGGNWGTPYRGFRVVEVLKDNSIQTYMMNPTEKILENRIPMG